MRTLATRTSPNNQKWKARKLSSELRCRPANAVPCRTHQWEGWTILSRRPRATSVPRVCARSEWSSSSSVFRKHGCGAWPRTTARYSCWWRLPISFETGVDCWQRHNQGIGMPEWDLSPVKRFRSRLRSAEIHAKSVDEMSPVRHPKM
jgi:hypothetical protein